MNSEHRPADVAPTDLAILEQRARSLASEPAGPQVSDRVSLLLFRIGEEWYAVRLADVREIFQEYEIMPIPCVLGVTNVRGEILSVTDPARLLALGSTEPVDGSNLPAVVISNGTVATALVVAEIGDIAEVATDSFEPPVSIIDRAQGEFIEGSAHVGNLMVGLLDVERVLRPVGGRNGS
jgi:purine-binding chemotaxis protein CheW